MSQGERRLAAIMFTDMVGYQDLVRQDESLAKHLLDKQRSIIRQALYIYGGRDVGGSLTAGEESGLKGWIKGSGGRSPMNLQASESLLLFERALDSTRCAAEIQRMLREYNREAPTKKDIYVRIGIDVGDVTERDGEVFGETVAIASRVAPLAESGGICVSEKVYRNVRDRSEFPIIRLGRQELKNTELPMEVYKLTLPWEKQAPGEPAAYDPHRLAILPLANISADPSDEYLADGMTEELISTTSSITGLTLIARTSVMSYKGTSKKVREIGSELEVGTVLEGSVRKAGKRLRITVQLIDVQSQGHLWAQSYDRDFDDVFAVQSDIAKQVADALRVRMLPNETQHIEKRPTKSTEAYTLYLKGRYYWNERSKEGLLKAIEYFTEAIERDQGYALAYSGMSDCYSVLGDHQHIPYAEAFAKAKENALNAVQLDDSSAEAHASLASALSNEYNWEKAEREFKKSLELNPNYATGHHWYGILLMGRGKLEESLREASQAQLVDPLSPQVRVFRGIVLDAMGRYDLAEEQMMKVLEYEPNFPPAHGNLFSVYLHERKYDQAEREAQEMLRLTNNHPSRRAWLAVVNAWAGKKEEAMRILEEVSRAPQRRVCPQCTPDIHLRGFGRKGKGD